MNNCELQCPDQLELLAQLAAKVEYLYQFYRNLSLSDLTDVKDCLAPTRDQHLVYDGTIWDAADQTNAELTIEPLLDSGVPIANITFNGGTTTLYCKDGTNVRIVPKNLGDDAITIADVYLDGQKVELKQKNYDNIELGDKVEIIRDIVSGTKIATFKITRNGTTQNTALYVPAVAVTNTLNSGTKVATIEVGSTSKDIYVPKATDVQVTPLTTEGNHIATISVDGVDKEIYSGEGGGGGSDFDVSRIKAGNYITLTYLDQNEQEVPSPQDAYYVKIDANLSAIEETISQWERVVANALARHEQAIQELQNS